MSRTSRGLPARILRGLLEALVRSFGDRSPSSRSRRPTTSRRPTSRRPTSSRGGTSSRGAATSRRPSTGGGPYPGDHEGALDVEYTPHPDGAADPGEVVWTWVPYEEDHSRGKDRPVLVVGRDGPWLLALMLTSKDHDRDGDLDGHGRRWMDLGHGDWDARGRASEVRLDRVVRVDPDHVRREGARLPREIFDAVAAELRG